MQTVPESAAMLAWLDFGGGQLLLIGVLLLVFCGARLIPPLAQGLWRGLCAFRDASDEMASDAGRSIGGIHGKAAAQALTPENQIAELYDPAVFRPERPPVRRAWRWLARLAQLRQFPGRVRRKLTRRPPR